MMSTNTHPKEYRDFLNTKIENIGCSNYGLAVDKFGYNTGEKLDYIVGKDSDKLHFSSKSFNIEEGLQLAQRNKEILFNYYKNKGNIVQLPLQQNWRMVLNLGATTAYNNGFLLHKLYGVPYIPGQAIKGALRHYCITTYFESQEESAYKNASFRMLFGNEEVENVEESKKIKAHQGNVVFFDIFPTSSDFDIVADIMSPHHTKYYDPSNLSSYPNDTSSPIPIRFLTLQNGKFILSVFIPKKEEHTTIEFINASWESPKKALTQLLKDAMRYQGIGAKTNLGYGRLLLDPKGIEDMESARKAAEEKSAKEKSAKEEIEAAIHNDTIRKTEAEEKGITPYIKDAGGYGDLLSAASLYKTIYRKIPIEDILPIEDHAPFLEKLTAIYSTLNKNKKKKGLFDSQSKRNTIKDYIGTEKMEKWFTENVKQI